MLEDYMESLWYRVVEGVATTVVLPLVATLAPMWPARLAAVGAIVWLAAIRLVHWRRCYDELWDDWRDARVACVAARAEGASESQRDAIEDLEEVLAVERWSPEAREGIRACISQLRWGDHRAHLDDAKRKAGV